MLAYLCKKRLVIYHKRNIIREVRFNLMSKTYSLSDSWPVKQFMRFTFPERVGKRNILQEVKGNLPGFSDGVTWLTAESINLPAQKTRWVSVENED